MAIKHIIPIEFRMPTDSPTETGWYYASRKQTNWDSIMNLTHNIEPIFFNNSQLYDSGIADGRPGNSYIWYGPVTEVRHGSANRLK